jgi:hypothetical protein
MAVKTRCHGLWLCSSLVFLVLPQFGCESAARTQQAIAPHTYSASFELSYWRESGGRLYIPLWVETPPSRKIYPRPEVGIQIERVEVDGRTIPAMDIVIQGRVFDARPAVRVDDPFFVYQVEAETWNYLRSNDEKEKPKNWTDYELLNARRMTENENEEVAYRIPYDAKRITIEYRLRYSVGGRDELGPMITVVADRNDDTVMNGN